MFNLQTSMAHGYVNKANKWNIYYIIYSFVCNVEWQYSYFYLQGTYGDPVRSKHYMIKRKQNVFKTSAQVQLLQLIFA